ncbi:gamma-glutamyltranspeptidase [Devosia pacifica]|uniref:Glutathione hydrolase proenzyme n=1 Tax=Devosia pacifica TaxID=1335967 RepID=A0A918S868_9HYPH|nr:gamma-glutamyltransferase [Devosia pacifica]GHA29836.1 gamma-glutamyltranspeptidase [Devosia pacifica]
MAERDFMVPGKSVALAENGMAATSHPLATLTAVDILRAGGNAVDAAIAGVALQCVIDPHMTGIGGDCFALYAPAGKPLTAFNGSGRSPAGIDAEALRAKGWSSIPDLAVDAVTIPGAVDAWCQLSETHGTLGLDQVLAPAIKAAEEGFVITPRVALDWARYAFRLEGDDAAKRQFLPKGRAPKIGERLTNPKLAATLRRIGAEGRSAFYEGEVAADIVAALKSHGGVHTDSDLAGHAGFFTDPIGAAYRGKTLNECPPNGQGLAALIITRILEGFDLAGDRYTEADRIHLLAEATKAGYRQRDALISDPETMTASVEDILSDQHINRLRELISLDTATGPEAWDLPVHRDTVYLTVVDRDGNAISLINSLFFAFGSGIYAPNAGVLLQNRGAGFSLKADHPNSLAPNKRPFHTIIPAIVSEAGRPLMTLGVMGGQYQATGHAHMMSQVFDRGLDIQAASDQPRSFFVDGELGLEPTISDAVRQDLNARGHATRIVDEPIGGCQAIMIDYERGVLWGASDHRKDGIALGY